MHNPGPAELDQILAEGGALEALMEAKKAGKIGHIGLTAHLEAVFERALELPWVETIMFPYNIVENQGEALMRRCTEKGIGFVCMKPLAGGAIEDGRLALRYILANPDVTVAIPGMAELSEIDKNLEAAEDKSPISEDERSRMEAVKKQLGTNFCRRCNYCAPCPQGVNISGTFLMAGYLERYGLADWARERYASFPVKAGACVECGLCETRCPYQLPIREMLKNAVAKLGE